MTLLLHLVAAHLVGDFILQPDDWAEHKKKPKVLLRHLVIHGALLALVVVANGSLLRTWLTAAGLLLTHGIIDWFTAGSGRKSQARLVVDQGLHAASIIASFIVMSPLDAHHWWVRFSDQLSRVDTMTFLIGLVVNVWVGRYLIGNWIAQFVNSAKGALHDQQGLAKAGARIGMLERLLIFIALVSRMESLAGFVIGVKALLRLPEAAGNANREIAEYFLLGTLASSAWAVLAALLTRTLMDALR